MKHEQKEITYKGGSIKQFLKTIEQTLKPGEKATITLENPYTIETLVKETLKTKIMVINGTQTPNGKIKLTIKLSEKN